MRKVYALSVGICGIAAVIVIAADAFKGSVASSNAPDANVAIDARGNLHVPRDYRSTYEFLGSWAVAVDEGQGAKELHMVYGSPGTVETYRKTGHFADGAVLVKEVFGAITTGRASRAENLKGWFVMVRDSTGRYQGKVWGEGWGWSWFDAADRLKTASTDYRTDCQSCHEPARASDMVYVGGYPPLKQ